jgi:uncharacterized protein
MDTPLTAVSPAASPFPDLRPFSIGRSWGLVALLVLFTVAGALPMVAAQQLGWDNKTLFETLGYLISFGLAIWVGFRWRGSSRLAFAPVRPVVYGWVALGTVALGLLLEPLVSLLPVPDWLQQMMAESFTKDAIWMAVLAAPLLEEILLRGIIQDGLLRRYSPATAIVWSAVIFGVMHLNPVQTVGATVLGLALGWLYYRTQSLLPCIFLHFVNNALGSLPLLSDDTTALNMSKNYTRAFIDNDLAYAGLLLLAAGLVWASYRTLDRMLLQPVQNQPI